jgi:predicted anti-sigma-YlaC factor YlaD
VSLGLDGELSEIEEASLRAHVGRCAECAGLEHDMGVLTRTLRTAPLVPMRATARPGGGPAVEVMLPRRRGAAVRVLQISAAAAAVVLAAGLGSLAGSLSSRNTYTMTTASTGSAAADALDRAIVARARAQQLPVSRTRRFVAL